MKTVQRLEDAMDFEEIESFLTNIKSVQSCKIIADSEENITEIHVLSDSSRHSKQIVRDIRTTLLSHFNLDEKNICWGS